MIQNPISLAALGIDIVCLKLKFRALEQVNLPQFSGSTWRGALGQALRRTICVYPNAQCHNCPMQSICWYARLYATTVDPNFQQLHGCIDAPHPLIPKPSPLGGIIAQGKELELNLTLIGQAREAIPILIQAVKRMATYGLGRGRGRLELIHWELDTIENELNIIYSPQILTMPITMYLQTPLRLRVDNNILTPHNLELRPLFTTLLRRISLFAANQNHTLLTIDFKKLALIAETIKITERQLEWFPWQRYSSRQQNYVTMDGLIGTLKFDLSQATELWPYLWIGQWLHIGKGTSMGMGHYTLLLTGLLKS